MTSSPKIALLFQRTLAAGKGLAVQEAALSLAAAVLDEVAGERALPAPPERHSWRRLAEEVQHRLASGFAERLTLDELGRSCGVSPFHLSRVFLAVTGETVHRRLLRLRLRAAVVEVRHHEQDLTGLALRLGFSSHSHFSAAFRREYRMAPSQLFRGKRGRARIPARR